jgi:tetratricopeptide (TPR) repeat protein
MKRNGTYLDIVVLSIVLCVSAVVPQQIFAQSQKGMELFNSWKLTEAEKAFRSAVQANPKDTPSQFYLGLSLLLQDKHEEALDVLLKVKSSQDKADQRSRPAVPSELQIQLALARTRLELRQYPEAWKNLESARKEDAGCSDVYVYRGAYYQQQERNQEAIQELEKAIELDSKNPYPYYYEGLAYQQAGQPAKAVDALKMFVSMAPDAPEAPRAKELIAKLC